MTVKKKQVIGSVISVTNTVRDSTLRGAESMGSDI